MSSQEEKDWIAKFNATRQQRTSNPSTTTTANTTHKPNSTIDFAALRQKRTESYLAKRTKEQITENLQFVEHESHALETDESLTALERRRMQSHINTVSTATEISRSIQTMKNDALTAYNAPDARTDALSDKRGRGGEEATEIRGGLQEQRLIENTMLAVALESDGNRAKRRKMTKEEREHQQFMQMLARDEVGFDAGTGGGASPTNTINPDDVITAEQLHQWRQQDIQEKKKQLSDDRMRLPIYQQRQHIVDTLRKHKCIVLRGETGSGKSTQLAQYLYEEGFGGPDQKRIVCTQPRRVAAMEVSKRVAQEKGAVLGKLVGYRVRFDDKTCKETQIIFATDGLLLREFLADPMLTNYAAVIVDEAHERSVHTDILLTLLRDLYRARIDTDNPLHIVITSATIEANKFVEYFDNAHVVDVKGRMFGVTVFHTEQPQQDYVDAASSCAVKIHLSEPLGDVLIFLTGQNDIEECAESIQKKLAPYKHVSREAFVLPIYSTLPSEQQHRVFEATPPGSRKIILATNIAETSLTIDGIVYVIDSGLCKLKMYDPTTDLDALVVEPISRAQAEQRKGRAGRTKEGFCYRLFTKSHYETKLTSAVVPEIQRTNISSVILELKVLGVENFVDFEFLDPPPKDQIRQGFETLLGLQAINLRGELTKTGRRMAEFPLDPKLSKSLVMSETFGCSEQVAAIVSMVSVSEGGFAMNGGGGRKKGKEQQQQQQRNRSSQTAAESPLALFHHERGDHLTYLNVFEHLKTAVAKDEWCRQFSIHKCALNALNVYKQLLLIMDRVEIPRTRTEDDAAILKSMLAGHYRNIATVSSYGRWYTRIGGSQRGSPGTGEVHVHPACCLVNKDPLPQLVFFDHIRATSQDFMMHTTAIQKEWLVEVVPHVYGNGVLEKKLKKK